MNFPSYGWVKFRGFLSFIFNPYLQISGTFLRPFYWKTHPSKNHEYLFSFLKNRVVSWTVLLENSSIWFFDWNYIWYVTFGLDEFSSKTVQLTNRFFKKLNDFLVLMIFWWMSFPVKRPQKCPRNLPIRVNKVKKGKTGRLCWM